MKRLGPSLLLLLLAVETAACGAGTPRTLQSVAVSPMTADAQNFPNGQVQFTATGVFNRAPMRVTPFQVAWLTSSPSIATIDSNTGLAQCVPGQNGMVTIDVGVPGDGPLMQMATLTCP